MIEDIMSELDDSLRMPKQVMASYLKVRCPKAFALCVKKFSYEENGRFLNDSSYGPFSYWESKNYGFASTYPWNDRNLYDLFDEHWISIEIHTDNTREGYGMLLFDYSVNWIPNTTGLFRTRQEAETAAFTHAFFKLEENIK